MADLLILSLSLIFFLCSSEESSSTYTNKICRTAEKFYHTVEYVFDDEWINSKPVYRYNLINAPGLFDEISYKTDESRVVSFHCTVPQKRPVPQWGLQQQSGFTRAWCVDDPNPDKVEDCINWMWQWGPGEQIKKIQDVGYGGVGFQFIDCGDTQIVGSANIRRLLD